MKNQFKKIFFSLVLVAILIAIMGMSSFDGDSPDKLPVTDKNISVIIVDLADVRTKATRFSINGTTFITGKKGRGSFAIPLEKISRIDFRFIDDKLEAHAELIEGLRITLAPDASLVCFGETDYGVFRIKLGDIKQLIVEKQVGSTN